MHYTASLSRLASTKCGMRKILKTELAPVDFIRNAVKAGVYKKIYYPDNNNNKNNGRNNDRGGQNSHHYMPKSNPYPDEYEILTLNPPLPVKPRLSKKDIRYLQTQEMLKKKKNGDDDGQSILPTEKLVKKYMQRYDARMKSVSQLTDSEREDAYYHKLLGVPKPSSSSSSSPRIEDMNTAMGRKPAVLNHAYEFALKQYEVLNDNENMTEADSIQIVESLLAKEEKDERLQSRIMAQKLVDEKMMNGNENNDDGKEGRKEEQSKSNTSTVPPSSTIPSILYSKPRTIQALHIWGKRLQAVPYNQWTLGASTALDHWIAVDVLGMKEETWNRLLDGELEYDIQESRGEDLIIGDKARMKDIFTVRGTLFPETVIHSMEDDEEVMEMQDKFGDAEDALSNLDAEKEATERSIDELLASLGGFEDEDKEEDSEGADEQSSKTVSDMVDSLQEWRMKNAEKPFGQWDDHVKQEFNNWLADYLALVTNESDGEVDIAATRDALLSEPPLSREDSDSFWSQVQDEADAEILLHGLRAKNIPAPKENESEFDKKSRESLELFLSIPYEKQLRQLINLGTLRPILDEYYKESDRMKFMDQYSETLLEGMEIEHLVSDPDGHITAQDIGNDILTKKHKTDSNAKFSIKMISYGTDEFGKSRSQRARMLFRAWNVHKAGRARYAESQFKKGKMSLKEGSKM